MHTNSLPYIGDVWLLVEKEKNLTCKYHSQLYKLYKLLSGMCRHSSLQQNRANPCFWLLIFPFKSRMLSTFAGRHFPYCIGTVNEQSKWANNSLWANADGRKQTGITWFGLTNSFFVWQLIKAVSKEWINYLLNFLLAISMQLPKCQCIYEYSLRN